MNHEGFKEKIQEDFYSGGFIQLSESRLRGVISSYGVSFLRERFKLYFNVSTEEAKELSKLTIIQSFVSFYFHGTYSISSRKTEKEVLDEDIGSTGDSLRDLYFHFNFSSRNYTLPGDIMGIILSFIPHNRAYLTRIGSINYNFYRAMLSTFPKVRIKKGCVHDISLLVLRTTQEIDFTNSLNFLSRSESSNLVENIGMNSRIQVLDFSGINYVIMRDRFFVPCTKKNISFPNCFTLKFTDKCKSKSLRKFKKKLVSFSDELKSSLPNLQRIDNVPYLQILSMYENSITSLNFSFSDGYENRGFDHKNMSRAFQKLPNLQGLSFNFRSTNSYVPAVHGTPKVSEDIRYVGKLVIPNISDLSIRIWYQHSTSLPCVDLSPKYIPPEKISKLDRFKIYTSCGMRTISFLPFEILDRLEHLEFSLDNSTWNRNNIETHENALKQLSSKDRDKRSLKVEVLYVFQDFSKLVFFVKRFSTFYFDFSLMGLSISLKKRKLVIFMETNLIENDALEGLLMDEFVLKEVDVIHHVSKRQHFLKKEIPNKIEKMYSNVFVEEYREFHQGGYLKYFRSIFRS